MRILVQKFGGTSVGDTDKIQRVADIIVRAKNEGYHVVTVVSAMGHTTDHLVELAQAITPTPTGREYDALLATGEMVSTALLAMALNARGCPAVGLNGPQAGVRTEDRYNNAKILTVQPEAILSQLLQNNVVIVTGFQGQNSTGDITTLGRGGSDTSAVALAAALNAERCDIYTDVRGVYTTDPRVVAEAYKQPAMAYIEMMELARLGAQVLHPRAVETAYHAQVTLCVRSTFDLDDPGTLLMTMEDLEQQAAQRGTTIEADRAVVGIACDDSQARVAVCGVPDLPGTAGQIFTAMSTANISVDMIIQSLSSVSGVDPSDSLVRNDIAFTITKSDLTQTLALMTSLLPQLNALDIQHDSDIAKVSIVGAGMVDHPGIAARMFNALATEGINIKMIATSEIKISCLVAESQAKQAVQALHRAFFANASTQPIPMVSGKLGY